MDACKEYKLKGSPLRVESAYDVNSEINHFKEEVFLACFNSG